MARLIKSSGSIIEVSDSNFTSLEDLQKAVNGYIEIIASVGNDLWIANEEGIMLDQEINRAASYALGFPVVGDVLVISRKTLDNIG